MKGLGSGGSANGHIQQCAEGYFSSITPTPLEKALHFSAGRLFCAVRDSGVGPSHPRARGSKESRNPSLFVRVRIAERTNSQGHMCPAHSVLQRAAFWWSVKRWVGWRAVVLVEPPQGDLLETARGVLRKSFPNSSGFQGFKYCHLSLCVEHLF